MILYSIVVTFNGEQWIEKCISSLQSSDIDNKIIVIDNGSTDGTQDILQKAFPEVQLIQLSENIGFGQANNVGLKMALSENVDFVFLLNQDAWVEPNTLIKLITTSKNNPEYGVISPVHLNGGGTKLDRNFSNYVIPYHCPGFFSDAYLKKEYQSLYPADFVNAAGWLIPRKTLEAVGGFDPLFFHYGEDRDYTNRVKFHGFKIGISPQCVIYHDREEKDNSFKEQVINQRLQLVNWKDINQEFQVKNIESSYRRRLFRNIIGLNFSSIKQTLAEYRSFLGLKSKILEHRAICKSKRSSFL